MTPTCEAFMPDAIFCRYCGHKREQAATCWGHFLGGAGLVPRVFGSETNSRTLKLSLRSKTWDAKRHCFLLVHLPGGNSVAAVHQLQLTLFRTMGIMGIMGIMGLCQVSLQYGLKKSRWNGTFSIAGLDFLMLPGEKYKLCERPEPGTKL